MDAPQLLDELRARITLAARTGTVLLLVGKDARAVEDAHGPLLAAIRAAGPFQVEDLGKADTKLGPVAWADKTHEQAADAFAVLIQPDSKLSARSFGRMLNGEREHLRDLAAPLLLLMCAEDERLLRQVAPDFFTWIAQGYELPPLAELLAHAAQAPAGLPAPAVLDPPVRFLHVSDIHFKTGAAKAYDRGKVLQGLLERLRRDREKHPVDLVFFTGDLANTAAQAEYASAVAFLRELLDATGVRRDHLFVVPGNHDVDRKVGRWALRTLRTDEESTDFFVEPDNRALHFTKFAAYKKALSDLLGPSRCIGLGVGREAVEIVEVRGVKLAVASFNSAWFAVADDDIEKLWLGAANVDLAAARIGEERGVVASIALMHHPTEYLADPERSTVERLLERSFDMVLRGHLHRDKAKSVLTGRGGYVELAAPAAYQGSQWPNGCFVGEIHASPRSVRVRAYKFGDGADPWTPDPSVFPDDDDGSHAFGLRERHLGLALEAAVEPMKTSIVAELSPATQQAILKESGYVPVSASAPIPRAAAKDLKLGDVFGELESQGQRLSASLREKTVNLLRAQVPPPPERVPPWGPDGFEALLHRLVGYWYEHRDAWHNAFGPRQTTYELATQAFFERQAGQPIATQVRTDGMTADLVIGSGDPRAVVGIKAVARAGFAVFELSTTMVALGASLGAILSFSRTRPHADQGVTVAQQGDRKIWLVYL